MSEEDQDDGPRVGRIAHYHAGGKCIEVTITAVDSPGEMGSPSQLVTFPPFQQTFNHIPWGQGDGTYQLVADCEAH